MKFRLLKSPGSGGRRGLIHGVERLPEVTMETPNLLLYTKGGLVPHLVPEVLKHLSPQPQAIMLPLPHLAILQERMKKAPMDIAQYIGLPQLINMVTIMDPAITRTEGFHKTDLLAVQSRSGIREFDSIAFMELIDNLKPDTFMALCDGDTKKGCSRKRVDKSMSRSLTMFKQCLTLLLDNDSGKVRSMIVPLEGGADERLRRKYARDVSERAGEIAGSQTEWTAGVVIDGIGQFGEEVALRQPVDYAPYIQSSLEDCEIEGLRLLPGPWHPAALFDLIELGIDLFDTSYPNIVTDRGGALLLPISSGQPSSKRENPPNFEISLKDDVNAEMFEPVMESCDCFCCANHTRAYIHHLLNVNEMLATVLLNIHNHQQYLKLFAAIRHSLDHDTFQQLKRNFAR